MKITFNDEADEKRTFYDLEQDTYEAILKFALKEIEKERSDF